MNVIYLTNEQKQKLIEICKALFPEMQNEAELKMKEWCESTSEDIEDYDYGFRLSNESSPTLYCSYAIDYGYHTHILPNNEKPGIHWFEFCGTILHPFFKRLGISKSSMFHDIELGINPIDHSYELFKLMNK